MYSTPKGEGASPIVAKKASHTGVVVATPLTGPPCGFSLMIGSSLLEWILSCHETRTLKKAFGSETAKCTLRLS